MQFCPSWVPLTCNAKNSCLGASLEESWKPNCLFVLLFDHQCLVQPVFDISWHWEILGLVSCVEAIRVMSEGPSSWRDTPLFHPCEVCQGPTGCYLVCLENLYLSRHRRGVKGCYSKLGNVSCVEAITDGTSPHPAPASPPWTSESLPISMFPNIIPSLAIVCFLGSEWPYGVVHFNCKDGQILVALVVKCFECWLLLLGMWLFCFCNFGFHCQCNLHHQNRSMAVL